MLLQAMCLPRCFQAYWIGQPGYDWLRVLWYSPVYTLVTILLFFASKLTISRTELLIVAFRTIPSNGYSHSDAAVNVEESSFASGRRAKILNIKTTLGAQAKIPAAMPNGTNTQSMLMNTVGLRHRVKRQKPLNHGRQRFPSLESSPSLWASGRRPSFSFILLRGSIASRYKVRVGEVSLPPWCTIAKKKLDIFKFIKIIEARWGARELIEIRRKGREVSVEEKTLPFSERS